MSRPTWDELKMARDGHTSAGQTPRSFRAAPIRCEHCGLPPSDSPGRGPLRRIGGKTVRTDSGCRYRKTVCAHEVCQEVVPIARELYPKRELLRDVLEEVADP